MVRTTVQGLDLRLAIQYIKKDLSPGRMEVFSLSKLPDAPLWLKRLADIQEAGWTVMRHGSLMGEIPREAWTHRLPLVDSQGDPMTWGSLDRISLVPEVLDLREDVVGDLQVRYGYSLTVHGTSGAGEAHQWTGLALGSLWVRGRLALIPVPGSLLIRELGQGGEAVAQAILEEPDVYQELDEVELAALWEGSEPFLFSGPAQEAIRVVRVPPVAGLDLRFHGGVLSLEIKFRYGSQRVSPYDKEGFLRGDEGQYLVRDRDFEDRVAAMMDEILEDRLQDAYLPPGSTNMVLHGPQAGIDRAVVRDHTVESFLEVLGIELLDAGLELRVEGQAVARAERLYFEVAGLGSDWLKVEYRIKTEQGEFRGIESLSQGPGGLAGGLIRSGGTFFRVGREDLEAIKALQDLGLGDGRGEAPLVLPLGDPQVLDRVLAQGLMDEETRRKLEHRRDLLDRLTRAATAEDW